MLLVDARAGNSQIHGLGLIAQEDISKGTRIWRFQPGFDQMIGESELLILSAAAIRQVRHYAFFDPARRVYVLSSDDDRFTNHSDDPNTQAEGNYESYAIRDIQAGEEITCSYRGWGGYDFSQTIKDEKT